MKERTTISSHLNKFNSIYNNRVAQEVEFPKLVKILFLLITLPNSWDTFRTTINNSVLPTRGLSEVNVIGILIIEEINCKNNEGSCNGTILTIKGRLVEKGKAQERSRYKSKTHRRSLKDIEFYH